MSSVSSARDVKREAANREGEEQEGHEGQTFAPDPLQVDNAVNEEIEMEVMSAPLPSASVNGALEDDDIYRGEPPPTSPIAWDHVRQADAQTNQDPSSKSSSSSSSSSSSLNFSRRLGALANVVEIAISRWARRHGARSSSSTQSSDSSSTSSSSSSTTTSGNFTLRRRRKRRNSSTFSLKSSIHERALLARKKAREELRVSPREFTLLLPAHLAQGTPHENISTERVNLADQVQQNRIFRTESMPLLLAQMESAIKRNVKPPKRHKAQNRLSALKATVPPSMPSPASGSKKGSDKNVPTVASSRTTPRPMNANGTNMMKVRKQGWWLDISSPTWEDMRALGKV